MTNTTVRYIYDGMLVIQERDGSNAWKVSYTQGRDLSGTLQGAGGVGELIARTENTSYVMPHSYYHADANGNITALVNSQLQVVARYLYDAFGNMLGMSGWLADANPYRFSSKEQHGQSGLYDYGYRFYDPNLQRWLNQDPLGERYDGNLYRFVLNNPNSYIDPDGQSVLGDIGGAVGAVVGGGLGIAIGGSGGTLLAPGPGTIGGAIELGGYGAGLGYTGGRAWGEWVNNWLGGGNSACNKWAVCLPDQILAQQQSKSE